MTNSTDTGRQLSPEGLRDLLSVVNSSRGLDEILAYLVDRAHTVLGCDGVALYLHDPANPQLLRVQAARDIPIQAQIPARRIGWPIVGMAVSKRRTVVISNFAELVKRPRAQHFDDQVEDRGSYLEAVRGGPVSAISAELRDVNRRLAAMYATVAAVPLLAHDEAYGTLVLYYRAPDAYGPDQVDLSQAFAQQAALAIENARLRSEAERRVLEIERRHRVAQAMRELLASINSTRSLDEVLNLVLAQAADLLDSDAGSVSLLNGKDLIVRASRGLVGDIVPARLPVGSAITGVAVERSRPVAVGDLLEAQPERGMPPALVERPGHLLMLRGGDASAHFTDGEKFPLVRDIARYFRALLAVPLVLRGHAEGAITLYYRQPRQFSPEDIGLALAFADQTALAIENARLHAQTVRRSRELEALYRADDVLHRSLRLDQVLQALVDVATDVMDADMTSVLVWDEHHTRLIPGATRGFRAESVAQMSHAPGEGITTRVALTGKPIAVEDVSQDPRVAHRITGPEGIQSLLQVPITVDGEVFGVFGVNYRQQRSLTDEHERMLVALAHHAALAIENARLYTESEHRRHDLAALYRADEALHRSLRLDDVLRALIDVARDVSDADKVSVHIWDAERKYLVMAAAHGYSAETMSQPLVPGDDLPTADLARPNVLAITDASDPNLTSARTRELLRREGIRAWIGAPITVSGQFFGLFGVAYCKPHTTSVDEKRLVLALAQRAGLAIHNARLFEQAALVATAEERRRLARELHDAVTQTLFSASLIAEVVPRIWERDQLEGRRRLEELRRLTRGALAEMRTLLLELRPAALLETPFAQLLRQLAEAIASRTNLVVDVRADDDGDEPLPSEVQIALYRIAQETLSNIDKHAGASRAEIHLRRRADGVGLHVSDDGHGFDVNNLPPGHLGLGIMHERARGIGARLRIDSQPGAGTRIHVQWRGVSA